jgi:hypothetical protein
VEHGALIAALAKRHRLPRPRSPHGSRLPSTRCETISPSSPGRSTRGSEAPLTPLAHEPSARRNRLWQQGPSPCASLRWPAGGMGCSGRDRTGSPVVSPPTSPARPRR